MMPAVKQLLSFCFSPVVFTTILLLVGFLIFLFRRQSRIGHRLILAGVGLYLIFMVVPIADLLIANLEQPYKPLIHLDAAAGIRTIVVLSDYGEDHPNLTETSRLSSGTIARMVEAIRLYRQLPGARLVVSGGILRTGDRPVANLMADFAGAMGVPGADIRIEGESSTTYENLVEVRKFIGEEPIVLVTSAYHMRRSLAVARKLGIKALPAPADFWATQHFPPGMPWMAWILEVAERTVKISILRPFYLQRAYHEYLGFLWYRLLGRV
jgi:uncharacterized SAM-binding protein YcdF (DUF218 family)